MPAAELLKDCMSVFSRKNKIGNDAANLKTDNRNLNKTLCTGTDEVFGKLREPRVPIVSFFMYIRPTAVVAPSLFGMFSLHLFC
mmetsp:Transcript_19253/g.43616  ORF Transcript_19253/g.43616 Transcript_19253/m.43616 type:complete len:84 (-) Transcript_19253:204-455(-)